MLHVDFFVVKSADVSRVAELANRKEGAVGEAREDVRFSGVDG